VKNVVYLPFQVFEEENRRWRVGGKETPMESIHQDGEAREAFMADLDEIAREGARRMLMAALKAEADAYVEALSGEGDERGHALVRRNGYAREREVMLEAGSVAVKAPRVDDRGVGAEGRRRGFKSAILPPYMRRSPKVSEVLPLLYLHGLSTGEFAPALEEFFGSSAGLSPSTITRLAEQWQEERERFMARDLSERDYVYVWADGVHTGVRLGENSPSTHSGEYASSRRWLGARFRALDLDPFVARVGIF
jgi:putative transposase